MKVAFKFHQLRRLLTVNIVIEYIFDSLNRYIIIGFYILCMCAMSVNEITKLTVAGTGVMNFFELRDVA